MRKWRWYATGVALIGILLLNLNFSEDKIPVKKEHVNIFRIASANIDFRNDQPEALRKRLVELDADVLVLLEWIPQTVPENSIPRMKTVITRLGKKHGIAVHVSKRFKNQSQIFYTKIKANKACRLPMGICRVDVGGKHLALLGVHIPPPHIGECKQFTNATLRELADLVQAGKLKRNFYTGVSGDPVIILGDLNAHPLNPQIRHFRQVGLVNALGRFARGLNPTWPARVPFVTALHGVPFVPLFRIDHILISKQLSIKEAWRFRVPGSDHRGVACDIYLNKEFIDE